MKLASLKLRVYLPWFDLFFFFQNAASNANTNGLFDDEKERKNT